MHETTMRYDLELAIGVLNGAIGDYLERTGNGLATPMLFAHDGRPLALTAEGLGAAHRSFGPRIVVFVHGLMSTESVWELDDGSTYGSRLAADLGVTSLFVRFNSGLHISENGEALDALLEALVVAAPSPMEELVLVGHSMGGLVIRSASHAGSLGARSWLALVKKAFYVGAPHLGAPLERFGNLLTWTLKKVGKTVREPITELIGDLIALRSSGVKDLRYGNLRREDWEGEDADALLQNRRHPVPLLPEIRHHLIAATLSADPRLAMLFGDALVPVPSATGRAEAIHRSPSFPREHVRIVEGMDHLRLAHDLVVYAQIRDWCAT